VALPVPKDILPILSKDAEKQKEIEARAAQQVLESKAKAAMSPKVNKTAAKPPVTPGKVPMMKLQAIPPWTGGAKAPKPPAVPIPSTAKQDIKLATSPTPAPAPAPAHADSAATAAATALKKLNPASKPFEFKPSAKAAAFQPGKPVVPAAPTSTAGAGPSTHNPFFSQPPRPCTVNLRDDFVPWKHGHVPPSISISKLFLPLSRTS
jgi:hypothetical protein